MCLPELTCTVRGVFSCAAHACVTTTTVRGVRGSCLPVSLLLLCVESVWLALLLLFYYCVPLLSAPPLLLCVECATHCACCCCLCCSSCCCCCCCCCCYIVAISSVMITDTITVRGVCATGSCWNFIHHYLMPLFMSL